MITQKIKKKRDETKKKRVGYRMEEGEKSRVKN